MLHRSIRTTKFGGKLLNVLQNKCGLRAKALTAVDSDEMRAYRGGAIKRMEVDQIGYSQPNISSSFSDLRPVLGLTKKWYRDILIGQEFLWPPIEVVKWKGVWRSMSNRRLFAAKVLRHAVGRPIKIGARIKRDFKSKMKCRRRMQKRRESSIHTIVAKVKIKGTDEEYRSRERLCDELVLDNVLKRYADQMPTPLWNMEWFLNEEEIEVRRLQRRQH